MALTKDDRETTPLGDGIEWLDLTPEIERVRPRRSRWTVLLLAAFGAVTGLGLAATNVMPQLTDRGMERRDTAEFAHATASAVAGTRLGTEANPAGTSGISLAEPVVATNRVELSHGMARVFVGGAAVAAGTRITVSLAIGGRAVATTNPSPASSDSMKAALAPWSAVLEVPLGDTPDDAVATVTVAWVDPGGEGGSLSSTVVLGDGRGSVNKLPGGVH